MEQTEAFRLLASADRQLVLHELRKRDRTVTIDELSKQVAARRHQLSPAKISGKMIERAHVRLVHHHLPQLEEKGVISHNWSNNAIILHNGEPAEQLFEAAEEIEGWPPDDLLEHPSRK